MLNKYVIFSFDDGDLADKKMITLLNKYNLSGTIFLNSGLFHEEQKMDFQEYVELLKDNNHYIGSHTSNHKSLWTLPKEEYILEISNDKKRLEEIFNREIDMFCYPGTTAHKEQYTDESVSFLEEMGFTSARLVETQDEFYKNDDFLLWKPNGHFKPGSDWEGSKDIKKLLVEFIESKDPRDDLFHFWTHSWELDKKEMWDELEEIFKLIKEHNLKMISYSEYRQLKINNL